MAPRLDPYPKALARFRPTPAQAAVRGAVQGLVVAGIAGLASALAALLVDERLDLRWIAVLAVPVAGGTLAGLVSGRTTGIDADDLGIHRIPAIRPRWPPPLAPWGRIADIRAERRGPRTVIAIYLDTGVVSRLPAPYDGRLLARDPHFEMKLFTLRNLWETYRTGGPR